MQDPFFIIKNVISCFAHDKTHQINLLGAELPSGQWKESCLRAPWSTWEQLLEQSSSPSPALDQEQDTGDIAPHPLVSLCLSFPFP